MSAGASAPSEAVPGIDATAPVTVRASARLLHVDALKAVASQLIVLHHLAFYGPMSDAAARWLPGVFEALSEYGRWAVQVFLVVGGYLAARSLAPAGRWATPSHPLRLVADRYLRLVLPLAATLVLALAGSALARAWMDHPSVPAAPSLAQVATHLLLLQDVVGQDALSAGVWYVAIDLQLFALLVAVLWGVHRLAPRASAAPALPWVVLAGIAISAFGFNRQPELDMWGVYFLAAYGLGVLAAWWPSAGPMRWAWGLAAVATVAAALALDWRPRLAVAVVTAVWLVLPWRRWLAEAREALGQLQPTVAWLGRISYSVFLVHFPVCLVVNAAFDRFVADHPGWQGAGVLLAWAASVAAGALFYRWVEAPAMRWVSGRARGVRCAQAETA
ncbi:MAG: acyltransferase family protein [Ideonella sp.]|nr:acyltransferase family protein [Ideonella sp.]